MVSGELYALITALLWSISALMFASVARRLSSVQTNILRIVFAEFYVIVFIILTGIPLHISNDQLVFLLVSGVVGLALGDSFLFRAFKEIGAPASMLLMALAPAIGALIAAVTLGERLGLISLLGMVVTLGGVAIVVVGRGNDGKPGIIMSPRGVVFGLLAAAGQGGGMVLAKCAFRLGPIDGFMATAIRLLGGMALLVPVAVVSRRFGSPQTVLLRHPQTVVLLALGAVVGPFLGIACSLLAVARTSVGVASTIMATVPVILLPLNVIVYREWPSLKAVAGACAAVAGVALLFIQ